jgi:cell division protein FtsW
VSVIRQKKQDVDALLAGVVAVLLLGGAIVIYSASAMLADAKFSGNAFFFWRQLLWLVISVCVTYLFSRFDYHRWERLAWPLMLISLGLLVLVLFSQPISGSRRWLVLPMINVQPSEIFKYILIIFLSAMLAIKRDKIKLLKSVIFPAFPIVGLGLALVLVEPDLGTVVVLAMAVLVLFFVAGIRKRLLLAFAGTVGLAAYLMVFQWGYKLERVTSWWYSLSDPLQASYQVKQSVLAIGSGGIFGVGLGRGAAKLFYLPAPHTDFIFATLAEEGGFIVSLLLLVLLAVLVWRGLRIAIHSPDLLGFFLALGITLVIGSQAALNLMVATALAPVTGLPLPLISYGGSSLLLTCFGIGILLNISRQQVKTPQLFREGDR